MNRADLAKLEKEYSPNVGARMTSPGTPLPEGQDLTTPPKERVFPLRAYHPDDQIQLYSVNSYGPGLTCDTDLLTYLGFTPSEQTIILAFTKERDLSVRALVAQAVRHYHAPHHPAPSMPAPALEQAMLGGPFDCGHRGLESIYPRKDGGSQCTECANAMRRADGTMVEPSSP